MWTKMRWEWAVQKYEIRSWHPGFCNSTHADSVRHSVHSICFVLISFISLNINHILPKLESSVVKMIDECKILQTCNRAMVESKLRAQKKLRQYLTAEIIIVNGSNALLLRMWYISLSKYRIYYTILYYRLSDMIWTNGASIGFSIPCTMCSVQCIIYKQNSWNIIILFSKPNIPFWVLNSFHFFHLVIQVHVCWLQWNSHQPNSIFVRRNRDFWLWMCCTWYMYQLASNTTLSFKSEFLNESIQKITL